MEELQSYIAAQGKPQKSDEVETRLELARSKGEVESLRRKNAALDEKVQTLLEILGGDVGESVPKPAQSEGKEQQVLEQKDEETKEKHATAEKEAPRRHHHAESGAFQKYVKGTVGEIAGEKKEKRRGEFLRIVGVYNALWKKSGTE